MPRPNQARSIHSEDMLARRIRVERAKRGWSLEGLADRMTKAGCSIQGSAIYKIEQGEPRRRITVDEAVAFAVVFGVPVERLLVDPVLDAHQEIAPLLDEWLSLIAQRAEVLAEIEARRDEIRAYVQQRTSEDSAASEAVREFFSLKFVDVDPSWEWAARAAAAFHQEKS